MIVEINDLIHIDDPLLLSLTILESNPSRNLPTLLK